MINLFNYIDRPSPIHRLTGATKLICLLIWSFAAMTTYDTRLLAFLAVISIILFKISKLKIRDVSFMLGFTAVFMLLDNVLVFVFSPLHGVEIYGTKHILFGTTGHFALTKEQLFYHINLVLKYLATIPVVLLFVSTTNPSEFAASLNKIGVPYSVAYSVALALRYIPDIQNEFHEIKQAQQARGIELSKKGSLFNRLKNATAILIPLILSSMDRIETISNAMELRGFGKNQKRSWYMARRFTKQDVTAIVICMFFLLVAFILCYVNGSRFWNPFSV